MKSKVILIVSIILVVALFACGAFFFSHNSSRVETLFNDTIKALDSDSDLHPLFTDAAKNESKTLKDDIKSLNEFYLGKSVEIEDFHFYRETNTEYRMYATVITDRGEYFVCMLGSGARLVDSRGLKQLIIEENHEFQHKKIFKKKEFDKYLDHAEEYGVTIRTKGDI